MNVSVLIPVYNAERYLRECLDSVAASLQRFLDRDSSSTAEISCLDDGSSDSSPAILAEYSHRFADAGGRLRFRTASRPNKGVSATRNELMDALADSCDAFAFCDADDTVSPEMYSTLAAALGETGADIAESEWDGRDAPRGVIPSGALHCAVIRDMDAYLLRKTAPGAWINVVNKLYRRAAVGDVRFREGLSFEEDFFFNFEVNYRAKSKVLVARHFYEYRDNPSSATHALNHLRYFESASLRIRLCLSEFLARGRIPADKEKAYRRELAKDAYRMLLRKNLKKNGNAAERRAIFMKAGEFFSEIGREFGFLPEGLNPIQKAIYTACLKKRYRLASVLILLT